MGSEFLNPFSFKKYVYFHYVLVYNILMKITTVMKDDIRSLECRSSTCKARWMLYVIFLKDFGYMVVDPYMTIRDREFITVTSALDYIREMFDEV